jgi:FkbM family methyltransferase
MKLFPYDAYSSLTRFIPRDESLIFIDVGANEGQTILRMLTEFPNSKVYAFEPAPGTFRTLELNTSAERRAEVFQLACGASEGTVDFHVTSNHWCSSVLRPSDLGRRFYGEWYNTREVVKVRQTTLDAWAARHGVDRVDVLKVDAQGYDLEVLRGATKVLASGVRAINCECQFAPEYEGCASFSQIDRFLNDHGYALHQLHEVHERGHEQQTTYGDGLWLRTDVLEQLRRRTDLPDPTPIGRVRAAMQRGAADGLRRVALYGSGRHTQGFASRFAELPLPVVAVIDDNPEMHGRSLFGVPIVGPDQVQPLGVDLVILSSDVHERHMWQRSELFRRRGLRVEPLYDRSLTDQHTFAHAG